MRNLLPLFFAADRLRYARWLSLHVLEMEQLPFSAPAVYDEFVKGNFVVRRSLNTFSSVSGDMAPEQSLNRDVKYDGGLIGRANKDNARSRELCHVS